MPRRSSGPRLWFDKKRRTFTIIDGQGRVRTGFRADEIGKAEAELGHYIASKYTVKDSATPFLSDVLATYSAEHLSGKPSEKSVLYDIKNLTAWWGAMLVTEINSARCKGYVRHRGSTVMARRELAFLNAALTHWHREHGPLKIKPAVVLPDAPAARSKWMTRGQAAKFLWAARRTPHVARFFIIGWYTGSRRSVINGLLWSMVDLKTGIMQRMPPGAVQAKNKQSPPVRMGARLKAHMRRWKRLDGKGAEFVIQYRGKQIDRAVRSWQTIRKAAKLPTYITPHILRHTRATNMMQQGQDPWESSKALGMSLDMLTRVYGHHHPDWQKNVAETK
jgi:integrase